MPAAARLDAFGLVAADFTDPEHERLIMIAVAGLIVLGLAMLAITIVWWRGTRSEHEALAPLEVMGERSWMKATFSERRRRLDSVRPPTSDRFLGPAFLADELDLRAARKAAPAGFDDLREHLADASPADPATIREAAPTDAAGTISTGVRSDDTAAATRAPSPPDIAPEALTAGPSEAAGPDDSNDLDTDHLDGDPESSSVIDPLLRGSTSPS